MRDRLTAPKQTSSVLAAFPGHCLSGWCSGVLLNISSRTEIAALHTFYSP